MKEEGKQVTADGDRQTILRGRRGPTKLYKTTEIEEEEEEKGKIRKREEVTVRRKKRTEEITRK